MSGSHSGKRKSSDEAIPHTRIQDDAMLKDNYETGVKLGQGTFGKVYEATHKTSGIKWAIKSINKEKAGSSALKALEREVAILKRVKHPNIIDLNEVIESPKRMYLVMEMCTGGELADVLKEKEMFTEAETKKIMQQLGGAISYLHKNGIVHRDLKLENVLIGEDPENKDNKLLIKVTDFGLSVVKGAVTPDNMMQDFCGTPIYMAPEILDNKAYSQQCDVWALGIIMYTLLCGHAPFRAKDETNLYSLIREAKVEFGDPVWSSVSQECKSCIVGMLKVDPAHRLSAAEVLNHPWMTGQKQDTNKPANVLEMMKLWKDELMHDNLTDDEEKHAERIERPRSTSATHDAVRSKRHSSTSGTSGLVKIADDKLMQRDPKDIRHGPGQSQSRTSAKISISKRAPVHSSGQKTTLPTVKSPNPSTSTTAKTTTDNGLIRSPTMTTSSSSKNITSAKGKKK